VVFVCLFLAACGGGLPVFLFSAGGFVFLPVLTGCFGQACSDSNSPAFWLGCFCLESLILAQDERWRRA
jgi:hypothetical protein